MEFLVVFGFVLLMILPLVVIFYTESNDAQDALNSNQIKNIAIKLVDKSETIYYLGAPSRTTLKVFFPNNIQNVTFANGEIIFTYRTATNSMREIIEVSKINITGNVTPGSGVHFLQIQAEGDSISITDV